jgi:hypothetical protein
MDLALWHQPCCGYAVGTLAVLLCVALRILHRAITPSCGSLLLPSTQLLAVLRLQNTKSSVTVRGCSICFTVLPVPVAQLLVGAGS